MHSLLPAVLGICGVLLAGGAHLSNAQGREPLHLEIGVFGATGTEGRLPFWLAANEYGTVDPTSTNAGLRIGVSRPFTDAKFDYAFGVEVLGRASEHGTFHAQELYGQLRYGRVQATVGWKKRTIGRVDTARSLGGITLSKNATPLPKLSVSTTGYVPVPGTNGVLGVNLYMGHGWMEEERFVSNALLHEKYGYLRILPSDSPVTLHAGLIHHAFWGGNPPEAVAGEEEGAFRDGLRQLGRVLVAARDAGEVGPDHMGNYDFSVDVETEPVEGRVYRQFFFEDAPGLWFRNVWDGLWGVSLQRKDGPALLETVLYEHFRLIKQGLSTRRGQKAGANLAFSHTLFRGGWTYQGRTLGLPLVTPPANTPGIPNNRPGIANSLVVAHHVAVEGTVLPNLSYRLTGTYSENSGSAGLCSDSECSRLIDNRFPRIGQWSFLAEAFGRVPGTDRISYDLAVALDAGDFRDDSIGVRLGLTWQGLYAPGGM